MAAAREKTEADRTEKAGLVGRAAREHPSLARLIAEAAREGALFHEGRRAYRSGLALADCPHPDASPEATLWCQGYEEAQEAAERRRW